MPILTRFLLLSLLFQVLFAAGCASEPCPTDENYVNAQELKLKIRELADQMLSTTPNDALQGLIAIPTSFVSLDNTSMTSPFGNLLGESLIYEFNQRGFPVFEYRLTNDILAIVDKGDFVLLKQGNVPINKRWGAVIVGTYQKDKDAIFVNARLVRATDGMVLRTGQLVLVNNSLISRLSINTSVYVPPNATLTYGSLPIKQRAPAHQ